MTQNYPSLKTLNFLTAKTSVKHNIAPENHPKCSNLVKNAFFKALVFNGKIFALSQTI